MDCQRQKRLLASRRATDTSLRDGWQPTQFYELEYCALQACAVRSVWGFVLIAYKHNAHTAFFALPFRALCTMCQCFLALPKGHKGHGK